MSITNGKKLYFNLLPEFDKEFLNNIEEVKDLCYNKNDTTFSMIADYTLIQQLARIAMNLYKISDEDFDRIVNKEDD
jgi:hypothetical protein